jgi:hypothetical protein
MKMYGGVDVQIHVFLTSALVCERLASCPGRFIPKERAPPVIYWIGGWVATELVWTTSRGEKSCPYQDRNSDPSTVKPVASQYTDWAIPPPNNSTKQGPSWETNSSSAGQEIMFYTDPKCQVSCTLRQVLLEWSSQGGWDRACSTKRGGDKCIWDFGGKVRKKEIITNT